MYSKTNLILRAAAAVAAAAVICFASGNAAAAGGPMTTMHSNGFANFEMLGKHIYEDKNLSYYGTQSCKSCHDRSAGWADPDNVRDPVNSVVSTGADGESTGGRNSPTAAYAGFSPELHLTEDGWVGGMFWDGRATGWTLGDPLAEQAQGPFLNPVEMMMPNKDAVVAAVEASRYANLFRAVFGADAFVDVDLAYDNIATAIAAYERSPMVTRFNSRFDRFWLACRDKGIDVNKIGQEGGPSLSRIPEGYLSRKELRGLELFNSKANCALCHATTSPDPASQIPPLFTDFSYDNVGIPWNPLIGNKEPDLGLGGFLDDPEENGKFKVPTLRNIAATPPYGHNGYFPDLRAIIDFYNTRDVAAWPIPEVEENVNDDELGDLGLSRKEVDDLIAFLQTLTDGPFRGGRR